MAQQIWRAYDGTEFETERECRQYEEDREAREQLNHLAEEEAKRLIKENERKEIAILFQTLLNLSPKGPAAEAYWEKVSEQKKSIPDENYAMISNCLSKFHRGVMNANAFYEQMDREMSLDEMKAIFRDIKFTHKIFGWD